MMNDLTVFAHCAAGALLGTSFVWGVGKPYKSRCQWIARVNLQTQPLSYQQFSVREICDFRTGKSGGLLGVLHRPGAREADPAGVR